MVRAVLLRAVLLLRAVPLLRRVAGSCRLIGPRFRRQLRPVELDWLARARVFVLRREHHEAPLGRAHYLFSSVAGLG